MRKISRTLAVIGAVILALASCGQGNGQSSEAPWETASEALDEISEQPAETVSSEDENAALSEDEPLYEPAPGPEIIAEALEGVDVEIGGGHRRRAGHR